MGAERKFKSRPKAKPLHSDFRSDAELFYCNKENKNDQYQRCSQESSAPFYNLGQFNISSSSIK